MLNHSSLRPRADSRTSSKRLGRGYSSGKWGSCGRGCKGQKARTGRKIHPLFEGGQTPLHMKLPKLRGGAFAVKTPFAVVNLDQIEALAKAGITDITVETLQTSGCIRWKKIRVKLLGNGKLTTAVNITANAASDTAKKAIEKAGGTVTILKQ